MKVPMLMSFAVLLTCEVFAQTTTPAPSFEVTSVRIIPNPGGLPDGFSLNPRRSGGRITWTTDFYYLTCYAYNLPGWRINGIDTEKSFYTIAATMDEAATEDQVRLMFQRLLAERLHFVAHRETRELSGYALVVAKNGPKLTTATAAGEAPPMPEYLNKQTPAAFEGKIINSMEGRGTAAIMGRGVSTSRLVETLSEELSAFVMDQTSLTGKYYFSFKFLSVRSPSDVAESPSLFTAIQDELGLRLEKQKGPVEVLVVDHVEKPSEN